MTARCDFCGRPFAANSWNQRTCVACETMGAPDGSKMLWKDYLKAAIAYQKEVNGRASRRLKKGPNKAHSGKPPPRTSTSMGR